MNFLDLIKEGRVDDFKSKYGSKFSSEQIKRITDSIPPKFLMWVGKNFDPMNFDQNFPQLYSAVSKFENIGSKWESDFVGEYYDDTFEDLTFWWERENKHWK